MSLFEIQPQDDRLLIVLKTAQLEAANAAEFKQEVGEANFSSEQSVCVDCAELTFIDSSGLGALLHLNNSLPSSVRPLALKNLRPEVLSVVELLRLNTVFALQD